MVNYSLGKIYKIVSDETTDVYIGSTCEKTLTRRLQKHRSNYKDFKKERENTDKKSYSQPYVRSFDILKYDDAEIILIEKFLCETKDELHARERHWIEKIPNINKVKPMRTHKEYVKDMKAVILQKMLTKHMCGCGNEFQHCHKKRHEKSQRHQVWLNKQKIN